MFDDNICFIILGFLKVVFWNNIVVIRWIFVRVECILMILIVIYCVFIFFIEYLEVFK